MTAQFAPTSTPDDAPRPGSASSGAPADVEALVEDAVTLARTWLEATEQGQTDAERTSNGQLAALVGDPAGLDLAVRFVDRVARPEDPRVAAKELGNLATGAAGFLRPTDQALLAVGSKVARLAPGAVVPLARRRLRQLVGHLVVDAHDPSLAEHLAQAKEQGFRLNINLLGEAVLGETEARARTERTLALLARDDVDYVSVKVSSLVSQISTWDTEGTTARVLRRLRPLYEAALARTPHAFVNLDMEEYRDLDLTVEVFTALLAEPELHDLEAGIVLQAYLPDSVAALDRLVAFARQRVAAGGAGIKIRVVKGANLSMERVEAELHGWAQAPYATKADVDANYLRLTERVLRPELAGVVRLGVASHNLYDVALAHLLAERRGVAESLDVEMLQGMAPAQARAVRDAVGSVLLYTPVVAPEDFDVAVSYLIRRLEENAQPQNFLHALFAGDGAADLDGAAHLGAASAASDGAPAEGTIADQEARFRASVAAMTTTPAAPRRTPEHPPAGDQFANTTDADPALPTVRVWAADRVAARPAPLTSPVLGSVAEVDAVVAAGRAAQPAWIARPAAERAAVLRRAADELEARRGELVTAMAAEGGKTVAEADPEVSEAIDFARYYADRIPELDPATGHLSTDGARFTPATLTLVTPPWNFPVAIPTGGVLAALAAGSAVVIKPAHPVPACTEVAVAAVHAALAAVGAPRDLLQVVRADEREVGRALVAHDGVDTVVLTGAIETARMFETWRAGRPGGPRVYAETSGKNALVITPAADYDLAVADLVKSAFGHAGQKCSAASLVILVGSAGTSARLRRQLVDAVRSLRVGWPTDLGATMGPVIEPPEGKLRRAQTTLEPGESWVVEPRPLDESRRLWSPGVKDGVAPGSFFHLTECFGPVLGIMRARTLAEAVELQNATDFGLTGGLHSLDEEEIAYWLDHVEVGNAYVNRHITGAIVQRQPFGGWKGSAVGPGAKAGGPNYVAQLGDWDADGVPGEQAEPARHVRQALADYTGLITSQADRSWLRAAVASDAAAWDAELGREVDRSGLHAEENVLRYLPVPLTVRAGSGAGVVELVRVLLAAELAGGPVRVSLDPVLSDALKALATTGEPARLGLRRLAEHVELAESRDQLVARVRLGAVTGRVRVIGDEAATLPGDLAGQEVSVLAQPVLATGRRELLTVLREQAVSRTLHRFGHLPPERD
ncbi:aldehyde dehydrogenase family protein [Georgenia yuyongxinii]|uniref:L-glutamate gamma-semialdehyde dehydrogenase n=1 Tax=Georgenia yuyongxinii TaxID=2589797 RepID=A0A5B8C4Z0_9MICO|nr:proline dehydrogenase family protein [Georgenia yuyongxinii]QDC25388.1 aldehyde dehydrogenase family protein [Georgenia yuyongxinii]